MSTEPKAPTGHEVTAGHVTRAIEWTMETVFVIDLLLTALTFAVIVIGGVDPFTATFAFIVVAVGLVVIPLHYFWFKRYSNAPEYAEAHHHERERRGY